MKKRILLLTTGGTIASQDGGNGLAPVLSSDDFLDYMKEFEDVCELVPYEVCSIDSTNMEASWWLKLAGLIQKNYTLYDAFLICHGTDTMAYTAAALSYLIQNSVKPIVLTGAQKSILQEITDARKNLHDSIRCALDDRSRDVMLVFDGKIIAGTRAKKTATFSYNAFSSINFPVLGQIHDNTVVYYIQKDICGPVRFFNRMDRKVFLLKLTPGMSTEIIPHILSVYDCIIIEGFGVGGLPDRLRQALLEEMQHYKAHEKILIMATQVTYEGSSMDTYVVGRSAGAAAVSGNLRHDAGSGACEDHVDSGSAHGRPKGNRASLLQKDQLRSVSKRVNRLDKTVCGMEIKMEKKRTRRMKMAMLCYVLAALCLVYCVGVVATKAAGTKFYLIWLAGTALFGLFGFFVQKGLWMRLPIGLRAGIGVLAGVGIACLCGLLVLIGSTFSAKGEQQLSYLIVLGAQMKPNGPSVVLEKRLRRAYTYLTENPETLCVLSGGQGSNEPVSEAQGMYDDLVKKGIDPKRLILEDQSTNTVENLRFSRKLIPQEVQRVGIVTSNFHVYRSLQLAKQQGFLDPVGISADSGVYFLPNNVLRECFGIVKDRLYGNLKFF